MPSLSGFSPSITLAENTVNATPQLLDSDVVFTDAEGNFNGGSLTLSGLLSEDRASVRNEGTGVGQIGLSGANVTFGGVIIGTLSGGVGNTLTITFNASATTAAIDALIQNLTYANVSDTPTASRTLVLDVVDAAGDRLNEAAGGFVAATGAANPFNGIDVGRYSTPTFVDLDGDGDLDAVVGTIDGNFAAFRNDGSSFTALTGGANPFNGFDVNGGDNQGYSAPDFVDIDGDGDQDLVSGERFGTLLFYRNTNGSFAAVTGAGNPLNGIDAGDFSAPAFLDLDNDGDQDMVVTTSGGQIRTYRNNGGSFSELTGANNPFNSVSIGGYPSPAFGDLDGDGDFDAVIGETDGTINYFENTGTATAPVFTLRTGGANPFNGFDVGNYSAPELADIDGDGDLDLVVGDTLGTISTFRNTSSSGASITVNVTAENEVQNGTPGNDSLSGAGDINGLGGDDTIAGAAGNQTLNGGDGVDTVSYAAATAGVIASLNRNTATDGSGGVDTLIGFENVIGSDFADIINGLEGAASVLNGGLGADVLIGKDGNDTLIGGSGAANELYGGAGNDLYIVSANDTLVENADAGIDTVQTTQAAHVLRANIENLTYTGGSSFIGLGNDLANVITGGVAADILNGGGGNDTLIGGSGAANTLIGGTGDDTYTVTVRDTIVEAAGEGTDTVNTTLNYFGLSANVENLTFTGTGTFEGLGNAAANVITGGTGSDTLRGNGGNDTLNGGDGFDTADFAGLASEYLIENLGGGQYRVTDSVGGRDGVDILNGMEQARFSDSRVVLSTIQPNPFPELSEKDAAPQVLPGVADDTFVELPLVLPGEGDVSGVDDLLTIAGILTPNERPGFMLAVGDAGLIDERGSVYDPGHDHWFV